MSSSPIFAQPRHKYDSYWDLWELVRLSNFPLVYFDEIEWDSDNVYIVSPLNGELPPLLPTRRCRLIWLNIERPSYEGNDWKLGRPDFDEIWVCDKNWAKQVGARHFIMGSHPQHGYYDENKRWDIITNTYNNPRRVAIWQQLQDLQFAPNGWQDRSQRLAQSHLAVVPQQDAPPHAVTPLRFAISAAFKLPMVYEAETDTYPFIDGEHFFHASYESIPAKVKEVLKDPDKLREVGEAIHHKLCVETNFRKSVEAM
jgi:hypothetical protein